MTLSPGAMTASTLSDVTAQVATKVWKSFPSELQAMIAAVCGDAWKQARLWSDKDLQWQLESSMKAAFGPSSVRSNVPLSALGVQDSQAQIDLVVSGMRGGLLVQVAGHSQPRHEKELLECMSISLVNPEFTKAAFVVCSSNALRLEGERSSFAYCAGSLLRLAEPALAASKLEGLLIVGLPSPAPAG